MNVSPRGNVSSSAPVAVLGALEEFHREPIPHELAVGNKWAAAAQFLIYREPEGARVGDDDGSHIGH